MEKAGKQKTLSNFPTATTTTNYNYLWDTDSEGKVTSLAFRSRPPTRATESGRELNFASKLKAQAGILALFRFASLFGMCKLQILKGRKDSDPVSGHHLESIAYRAVPQPISEAISTLSW